MVKKTNLICLTCVVIVLVVGTLLAIERKPPMKTNLATTIMPAGFVGGPEDVSSVEWISPGQGSGLDRRGPDLVAMARWAMHYLVNNPQQPRGYECRFYISPSSFPPALGDTKHDIIAVGDTENRMELAFIYIRKMTGMTTGQEIEEAIRSRLLSYVRSDGLCWCTPCAMDGKKDTEPAGMPWTTGLLMLSTTERYSQSGDKAELELAGRLFEGLKGLASHRGGMMWYEGGLAGIRDGKWLDGAKYHYPVVISQSFRLWQATGREDILEFAEAMTEGMLAGVQPTLGANRVLPDGSHSSPNVHLLIRAVVGVAQVGQATGNSRYLEWAKRVFEYTRSCGTDWGWNPENIIPGYPEGRYRSETCSTADMVECAIALAQAGYGEYWDYVERVVRNYLPEAQFFLTPEFVALYRKTHADKPASDIESALNLLGKFEGGFLARQLPNDWVYNYNLGKPPQMNMMGCCPPSGMRAMYLAWDNTVIERNGEVFVNMSLDRDAPAARVRTYAPQRGTLEVEARKAATFYVRPPSWTQRENIQVSVNDKQVKADWYRGALRFRHVSAGDKLRIDYPLVRFTQRVPVGWDNAQKIYEVRWVGNDVEEVLPHGKYLPIFAGSRRVLPKLTDPK